MSIFKENANNRIIRGVGLNEGPIWEVLRMDTVSWGEMILGGRHTVVRSGVSQTIIESSRALTPEPL